MASEIEIAAWTRSAERRGDVVDATDGDDDEFIHPASAHGEPSGNAASPGRFAQRVPRGKSTAGASRRRRAAEGRDVMSVGAATARRMIASAGLSSADCVEKSELRAAWSDDPNARRSGRCQFAFRGQRACVRDACNNVDDAWKPITVGLKIMRAIGDQ